MKANMITNFQAVVVFMDDESDEPVLAENIAALKRIAASMSR